ncbi:unnamed protein product [Phaedon cochleariae]|uniref:Alpha-tubulin N-acetyltransferase n=1 Tax=Phaedon cochleariae TaxID=80249 RepID=A0A9P0GP50_PHACE|nr:unnamed protein product [Phaedon cochleariae]
MEFNFNIADIFNQPIVEINRDLIPPGFRGDRRTLWNTVNKVSEVVNAIGEASAAAQGLPKPITSSERLKNSEHKLYLLIDQHANAGKGAVTGMLRTGAKGLYVFDKEGQHYQVSPPCILDFYIHESSQRKGLGRQLFQHMLHKEQVDPGKMAIDRPSEKLIRFLNKHYGLNSPMKQMNNYVVYEGFFPKKQTQSFPQETSNNRLGLGRKESANGLQSHSSPFGRYGASRPPTSIRKLLHNDPQDPITTTPPHHSHQSNDQNDNQTRDFPMDHQEYSKQPVPEGMQHNPATLTHPNPMNNHTINQQVLQGHHTRSNQNITTMNRQNQHEYSLQSQMQNRVTNSSPEIPNRNQAMYHQQQYHNNLQGMQSLPHIRAGENTTAGHQFDTEKDPQYNIIQNTGFYAPQTEQPQQLQQQAMNSDYSHYQHHQRIQPHVHGNEDQSGGYTHHQESAVTGHYPQAVSNNNLVGMPPQNLQKPVQFAPATTINQTGYSTQNQSPQDESHYSTMSGSHHNQNNAQQQVHMIPTEPMQYQQISNNNNSAIIGDSNNQNLNQMASQHALPQSPEAQTNSYGDFEKHQMPIISEEQNPVVASNDAQNSNLQQMIPRGADNDYSQSADPVQHQMPTNHQNSQNNAQFSQAEYNQTTHVPQSTETEMVREVIKKSSAAATNSPPEVKEVAYINPMDSRNMSNPNYISQVQYNPIQKTPVASRTTVPMEEGVLEYGYPPQLNRAQALHFQKSDVMSIN